MNPAAVNAACWSVVVAYYLVVPHAMKSLNGSALLYILLAALSFTLGVLLSTVRRSLPSNEVFYIRTGWKNLLLLAAVVGLPFYLARAVEISESVSVTESMFVNLRIALSGEVEGVDSFGILAYFVPVAFVSTLLELASSRRRTFEWTGWISLSVSLAYGIVTTGRTFIFLLFISLTFIVIVQRRVSIVQSGALTVALLTVVFVGIGLLTNKIGESSENAEALKVFDAISLYLLGGIAALDHVSQTSYNLELGLNAFRTPLAVLHSLGAEVTVVPLVKDFVNVPLPSNVYTAIYPYITDFGPLGIMVFFLLFGSVHGFIYQKARSTSDIRFIIAGGLAMYPLLMQFFQDQYMSLLSTWIVFALLILPICTTKRSVEYSGWMDKAAR